MKNSRFTNFGFKKVDWFEKTKLVKEVFDSVATRYDLMNDLMSLGVHRKWKYDFNKYLKRNNPETLIDVGGGTSDIALKFIRSGGKKAYVVDINPKLLEVGSEKAINEGYMSSLNFICANAEKLPFKEKSMDCYSTAFCIRNVTDIQGALEEAYRVLKPGGKFYCLEFSKVKNEPISKIYDFWSFQVIPKIGELVAKNREAYEYLVESIRQFPPQEEFAKMIRAAGFQEVGYDNQTFGIACIHFGTK